LPELRNLKQRAQRHDVFDRSGSFVPRSIPFAAAEQQLLLLLLLMAQLMLERSRQIGVQLQARVRRVQHRMLE